MEKLEGIVDEYACSMFIGENKIAFEPLQAIQRYQATIKCLDHPFFKKSIKRIVEFGCNEMKFFIRIKNALNDRDLVVHQVDIDGEVMERNINHNAKPCLGEYVKRREFPLNVHIWEGSITDQNPNFKDIDAVVAIELIEHVHDDVLNEIPNQIFGVIVPKIAVITTPNAEFNKLFNMKQGDFRHPDHKFEFNRHEFNDYCQNIISKYPNYHVQIEGIGPPPKEVQEDVGCCSQLALFVRKDFYESLPDEEPAKATNIEETIMESEHHKLLASISYPHYKDERTNAEKILDEAKYHVGRFISCEDYLNYDKNQYEVPIATILPCCWEITTNEMEIEEALKKHYQVENGNIILPNEEEEDYDEENEDVKLELNA